MPNAWQPRYFIVRDGWMYYFEEKKLNARPRGKIDLKSECVTLVVNLHFENSPTPHTMLINPGGYEEKWRLCAANSRDMEMWCECIKSHINSKQKRKPAQLDLPAYDSDNENHDEQENVDDHDVMIPQVPQAPPSLSSQVRTSKKKVSRGLFSPKKSSNNAKEKHQRSSASDGVISNRPSPSNSLSQPESTPKKKANKVRVKSDNGNNAAFEMVLTVALVNMCALFALIADKIGFSVLYFFIGNLVFIQTMYLFSKRVEKTSKELKVVTASKEKLELALEKSTARVAVLEDLAKQFSPDAVRAPIDRSDSEDMHGEKDRERLVPPPPGTTIQQVYGVPPNVPPHTWQICDPTSFNVRQGPNYSRNKKKGPSGPSIYEPFAVDTFCARKRIDHIAQHLSLPDVSDVDTHNPHVPPILMIQLQLPSDAPPLFGTVEDGPGWAIVMYFKISKWACEELKDLSTASPAIKLFAKYCEHAETDFAWRSRFKVITYCSNLEEMGVPNVIISYNAKPVIIRRTGSIFRGPTHMEIDIHIHKFANLAKKSIHLLSSHCGLMYMQIGFLVEGRTDDELPETLFACVGVNMPDEEKAEFLFDEEEDQED